MRHDLTLVAAQASLPHRAGACSRHVPLCLAAVPQSEAVLSSGPARDDCSHLISGTFRHAQGAREAHRLLTQFMMSRPAGKHFAGSACSALQRNQAAFRSLHETAMCLWMAYSVAVLSDVSSMLANTGRAHSFIDGSPSAASACGQLAHLASSRPAAYRVRLPLMHMRGCGWRLGRASWSAHVDLKTLAIARP